MASKTPLFESGRAHLKAGENDSITRGDESTVGELHEMVLGGGIAVRLLNGKAKSVPQKVAASDLEVLEFMAVISLAGEHEDGAWWMRKDQLVLRATDEGYNASKALKKSWGRVDKGRLPEPIFAPRLPGTAGANGDWHALLELVVEKHNAGEVPDLISFGARAPWLDAPNVFPTLRTIRDRNLAALKDDAEVKALVSDLNLEEMEDDDEEDEGELQVGMLIRALDTTVVAKGTYGKIVSLEPGKEYGTVEWELSNGGCKLGAPKRPPERIAFEGRFKYQVQTDMSDVPPLALRSGLGAVAALHGSPLLSASKEIDRSTCLLTHVVPDLGLLQSGTFLQKQVGCVSAHIYTGCVSERVSGDDDVVTRSKRMRIGQVFYEYKLTSDGCIAAAGVEEMYVFVGLAEEYERSKPTPPDATEKMSKPALLGLRFKRAAVGGEKKLSWLQGSSKSLEHDESEVVVSAVKCLDKVYVVGGDTDEIFGGALLESFDKVLGSSTLFRAHREHGLSDKLDWHSLKLLSSVKMSKKGPTHIKDVLVAVHAQMLYAVVDVFTQQFASLGKSSKAMLTGAVKELNERIEKELTHLRKHLLWLLRDMDKDALRELMTNITTNEMPALQQKALATLKLPNQAKALLQDEIPGADQRAPAPAPDKPPDKPSAKRLRELRGAQDRMDSAKSLKGVNASDDLNTRMGGGQLGGSLNSPATDLAAQLSAQLAKCPTTAEVEALHKTLRDETLRADREKQRADLEEKTSAGLREELAQARSQATATATATASSANADCSEVQQLKQQVQFLQSQVAFYMSIQGGVDKETAFSILTKQLALQQ